MGRLDAHAGYNRGAVGRARRLRQRVRPPGRNHGISRFRSWSQAVAVYVVNEKDTVESISQRYGVPSQTIIDRNKLKAPYTLKAGQYIELPGARFVADNTGGATQAAAATAPGPVKRDNLPPPGAKGESASEPKAARRPADAAQPGRRRGEQDGSHRGGHAATAALGLAAATARSWRPTAPPRAARRTTASTSRPPPASP